MVVTIKIKRLILLQDVDLQVVYSLEVEMIPDMVDTVMVQNG